MGLRMCGSTSTVPCVFLLIICIRESPDIDGYSTSGLAEDAEHRGSGGAPACLPD